jgi:hypothetical protein
MGYDVALGGGFGLKVSALPATKPFADAGYR